MQLAEGLASFERAHQQGLLLKVAVEGVVKALLQAVAVEPEEALAPVLVLRGRVLGSVPPELSVHGGAEAVPQEVRPEAEKRVHLLALPHTCTHSLCCISGSALADIAQNLAWHCTPLFLPHTYLGGADNLMLTMLECRSFASLGLKRGHIGTSTNRFLCSV